MQLYGLGQPSGKETTPQELCNLMEQDYHLAISSSCTLISDFLALYPHLPGLPVAASELVHLLFGKLHDELKHLLLKESGIIFPCIRNCKKGPEALCVKETMVQVIIGRQSVITALMQRIRQLLHNFVTLPQDNPGWKTCINAFFLLETALFQWIYIEQNLLYPAVQEHKSDIPYH